MTALLRSPLLKGVKNPLLFFFFVIFQLCFSFLSQGQSYIAAIQGSPAIANPCASIGYQLYNISIPVGANLSKVEWYGNGVYVGTTLNITDVQDLTMNANDGNWDYSIAAVAYFSNGTTSQTNYSQELHSVGLNPITQSGPVNLNCLSPVTFSSAFTSGLYVPTPNEVSSYTWSYPSVSWAYVSGNTSGNSIDPTVTVTPDAASSGNVVVTAKLSCGFPVTSAPLAITRPTPPPTFGSNPTLCINSTANFTINAPCGATSYNWTLSGNAGATFQANGTQSLTTTSTSAEVSTTTLGTSGVTLSVEAVYPGGVTSSAATDVVPTGGPAPIVTGIVDGEKLTGPGPFSFTMVPGSGVTAYKWSVAPEATISGQTTKTVTFTTPALNTGQSGDVYLYAQYESTCYGWSPTATYYFLDQGSGKNGLSLQGFAGMSQLAIIAGNQENTAPGGESKSNALKSDIYTIKAVNVYNTAGQLIKKASFGGTNTTEYLDIHDLPNGIYFIQTFTSNGGITKKFVVMH